MSNVNLGDSSTAFGIIRLIKRNSEGVIIEDRLFKNQLTNYARQQAANMWAGQTVAVPSAIKVGTGSPVPPLTGVDPTDAALWTAMGGTGTKTLLDYTAIWLTYTTQYCVTYQQTDAVGTWTELGLFDANGNMWSHVQVTNFSKSNGDTVTVQWNVLQIGN